MLSYIRALDAGFRFKEILHLAVELEQPVSATTGETFLTRLLKIPLSMGSVEIPGNAALALGKLDFVLHASETASSAAERDQDTDGTAVQRMLLANFKFRHTDRQLEAMHLWEHVLEITSSERELLSSTKVQEISSSQLSQLYYSEAVAAQKSGFDPQI